jgi:hypothetical protein
VVLTGDEDFTLRDLIIDSCTVMIPRRDKDGPIQSVSATTSKGGQFTINFIAWNREKPKVTNVVCVDYSVTSVEKPAAANEEEKAATKSRKRKSAPAREGAVAGEPKKHKTETA